MEEAVFTWIAILATGTSLLWLGVAILDRIHNRDCQDLPQNADRSTTPGEERS
jgi:hypothetical protein